MSDNTTTTAAPEAPKIAVPVRPLTKNGYELTPTLNELKRGDNKGVKFPHIAIDVVFNEDKTVNVEATMKNIVQYIYWKGVPNVAKDLSRSEKADAVSALNYASTKEKGKKADESGNLVDAETIVGVDVEKYFEYYLSDVVRTSGVNMTTLRDEKEDKEIELRGLFGQMVGDPQNATKYHQQIASLLSEIQDLEKAIDERKRGPRQTTAAAAVPAAA